MGSVASRETDCLSLYRDDERDVGSCWIAIDRHRERAAAPAEAPVVFPYLLAIPILIYEAIFVLYPIYEGIKSSFYTQANLGTPPVWVGLKNYRRLIDDEFFWRSLKQTFLFMGGVITASILFGLISAVVLNRAFFGRSAARGIITLPWAFPDVPAVLDLHLDAQSPVRRDERLRQLAPMGR